RHAVFYTYIESNSFTVRIDDEGTCWYKAKESDHDIPFAVLIPQSHGPRITSAWTSFPHMSPFRDQTDLSGELEAMSLQSAPLKGARNAPIVVVEFGEFGGQTSSGYADIARLLLSEYPEYVQIAFKHYPF